MYFSFEKTYRRKIAEFFVARKLEKTLTKEQIFDICVGFIQFQKIRLRLADKERNSVLLRCPGKRICSGQKTGVPVTFGVRDTD